MSSSRVALFMRPSLAPGGDLGALVDLARAADRAGLHSIEFGEHLVVGEAVDDFPYGRFDYPATTPWPDPIATLGAIAGATSRLRLSTGVLLAALRPATLLAKGVATLDALSNGRVEIGVGVGWQRADYVATGVEWGRRHQLIDDVIGKCRVLWGEDLDHGQRYPDLAGVVAYPRPVQQRLPVFYGCAATARNVARIAELGDGWCPVNVDVDAVAAGRAAIRSAFESAGRDPTSLQIRVMLPVVSDTDGNVDVDRTMAPFEPYVAAGATIVSIAPVAPIRSVEEGRTMFEAIVRHAS